MLGEGRLPEYPIGGCATRRVRRPRKTEYAMVPGIRHPERPIAPHRDPPRALQRGRPHRTAAVGLVLGEVRLSEHCLGGGSTREGCGTREAHDAVVQGVRDEDLPARRVDRHAKRSAQGRCPHRTTLVGLVLGEVRLPEHPIGSIPIGAAGRPGEAYHPMVRRVGNEEPVIAIGRHARRVGQRLCRHLPEPVGLVAHPIGLTDHLDGRVEAHLRRQSRHRQGVALGGHAVGCRHHHRDRV